MARTGNPASQPANAWPNWYRTVDLRLAHPLYTRGGQKLSLSAEVFNAFNWNNNLSYGGTQFTAAVQFSVTVAWGVTEPRPKCLLANELRVYGDKVVLTQSVADPGELFGGFDQAHGRALIA